MTKAITVSLLEDGTFFATFDDYKISEADDFVKRADSVAIPRNILYGPDVNPTGEETTQPATATTSNASDAAPMVYVNDTLYEQSAEKISYGQMKEEFIYLGKIESTDCEAGVPKENFQANLPILGCEVYQFGENIVIYADDAYWLYSKYSEPETNWDDLTEQEKMMLDPAYKG